MSKKTFGLSPKHLIFSAIMLAVSCTCLLSCLTFFMWQLDILNFDKKAYPVEEKPESIEIVAFYECYYPSVVVVEGDENYEGVWILKPKEDDTFITGLLTYQALDGKQAILDSYTVPIELLPNTTTLVSTPLAPLTSWNIASTNYGFSQIATEYSNNQQLDELWRIQVQQDVYLERSGNQLVSLDITNTSNMELEIKNVEGIFLDTDNNLLAQSVGIFPDPDYSDLWAGFAQSSVPVPPDSTFSLYLQTVSHCRSPENDFEMQETELVSSVFVWILAETPSGDIFIQSNWPDSTSE